MKRLVTFDLDRQAYALRLGNVRRVLPIVEVALLPRAPEIVLGVFDLEGSIVPVLSMRRRFGWPESETRLTDQLLIADTAKRTVALLVSSVTGVIEKSDAEIARAREIVPGAQYVEGIAKLQDALLFIHDLDRFLSPSEAAKIDDLLAPTGGTA